MAFPVGYTKYQEVTIDATKVSADLTDYVIYVDLAELLKAGADVFDSCRTDGGDIRVTKTDGTTELAREIVNIDTTGKTGELHVKFTGTLSSSTDTVIRVWYNGTDTEPAVTATYGRNNVWTDYFGVYHLGEDPSGTAPQMTDSTGNAHGTSAGSMTSGDSVAMQIENGLDFDGINDVVSVGDNWDEVATGASTVQFWASFPEINERLLTKGNSGGNGGWNILSRGDSFIWVEYRNSADSAQFVNEHTTATWVDSTVRSWAFAFDGTLNGLSMYQNGSSLASTTSGTQSGTIGTGNTSTATISESPGATFVGKVDELRFRSTNLSSSHIATDYNNQNAPSTFISAGAEIIGTVTQTLATTAQATAGISVGYFTEIAVVAQVTASMLKRVSKSIASTASATITLLSTSVVPVALAVTAQATVALSSIQLAIVNLAVTASATVAVVLEKSFTRTLSVVAEATGTLTNTGVVIFRTLAVTATATVGIVRGLVLSKALSAVARAITSLGRESGYKDKYPTNEATYQDKYPE